MRIKFRSLWTLVLLCFCCFLTACARETISEQTTESTAVQEEKAESVEPPTTTEPTDYVPEMSGKIDFRYIYRGFTGVPLDNQKEIEKFRNFGVQMVATEDEWHTFMDTYCPGIPYNEPWDFQEDYLLVSVTASADPAFAVADAVTGLTWENGSFIREYENNPVYALNTGEYTHFYVEVIAISKESRGTTPERTQTQSTGGNFETLYRGFTLVSLEDRDTFDKFMQFGTQIIGTAEDCAAFLDFYCPGNPCDVSLDFSEECVIATIMLGAKPGYAMTHKSLGIDPETGYLNIELDQLDPVYALNSGEYGHYFVELIKVNRSELPDNTDSWTYHS